MIVANLLNRFIEDELDSVVRKILLDAAADRSGSLARFEFNLFEVELNFVDGEATVEDALVAGDRQVMDLEAFLAAIENATEVPSP